MMSFANSLFFDKFSLSGDQRKQLSELHARKQRLALLMQQSHSAANKGKQIDSVRLIEESIEIERQITNIIRFNDVQLSDRVAATFHYDSRYISCYVEKVKKEVFIILDECDEPEQAIGMIGSVLKNVPEVKSEIRKLENTNGAQKSESRQVVISFPLAERATILNALANAKDAPRLESTRDAALC